MKTGIMLLDHFVAQTWPELTMINKALSENRGIKRIIELGTGTGGLTLFFGLNMLVRAGEVLSFDIEVPRPLKWFEGLNITFEQRDVFEADTVKRAKKFMGGRRTLIFCDDGNKPEEFRTYSKLLKRRDLIMVHDWGGEINQTNVDKPSLVNLEPYLQEEIDEMGARLLCMRRVR